MQNMTKSLAKVVMLLFVAVVASNLALLTVGFPNFLKGNELRNYLSLIKAFGQRDYPVLSESLASSFKGYELMDSFNDISDILEKEVKSDKPEENFAVVDKQLKLKWPENEGGRRMVEALKLFRSLSQVSQQCHLDAYTVLHKNSNAVIGLPQWHYSWFNGNRRVNKVVKQIQIENAKNCRSSYFNLFREQMKQLSPNTVQFATTLLDHLLIRKFKEKKANELTEQRLLDFILDFPMDSEVLEDNEFLLNELRRLVKGDPDERFVGPVEKTYPNGEVRTWVNFDKFEQLYEKYFRQPCTDYVDKLNTLFFTAEFATKMFKIPAQTDELEFYRNWAAFKLCNSVLTLENGKLVMYNLIRYQNKKVVEGKSP